MVGGLRDVITCAKFQIEIFMGYDFTGGRIFDFPIDFSMGLTTVQRYCAACDLASLHTGLQCSQHYESRSVKNKAATDGGERRALTAASVAVVRTRRRRSVCDGSTLYAGEEVNPRTQPLWS